MRRLLATLLTALLATFLFVPQAFAGSPHFVKAIDVDRVGDTLVVSGKIAGLGNEEQVDVQVTADANCVNPGGNKPSADNKQSFSADGDFPVQNGKAEFTLTLTATFQPSCTPPMTVEWSNVVVTAYGGLLTKDVPGTF